MEMYAAKATMQMPVAAGTEPSSTSDQNHFYEANDRTGRLAFFVVCTCTFHFLMSLALTGLVGAFAKERWSFVCQTLVLSASATILAWYGIRGARQRKKTSLIFFTIFF